MALEQSPEMVDVPKSAGGDVRFTVYPGLGHGSWTITYENPELYEWLVSQGRRHTEGVPSLRQENADMKSGTVAWVDLTVDDEEGVRSFYEAVAGWQAQPVDMGGYEDFNMIPLGAEKPVAGICHARGANADLPPQWLVYVRVEDVDVSAYRCLELGGELLVRPQDIGEGRFCVIRDPAGAVPCTTAREATRVLVLHSDLDPDLDHLIRRDVEEGRRTFGVA